MKRLFLLVLICSSLVGARSSGQQPGEKPGVEAAIRQAVSTYVATFNKHDAKALAALWSPDAVYTNRITGEQVVGQKALAEQFTAIFKELGDVKLSVHTESIGLLSPNVAVERGTAWLLATDVVPEEIQYSAVYVKRDGKWLLDRESDEAIQTASSHYEQLKALEWMVGSWVDQDDTVRIETECKWAKNQNFLVRSFTIEADERIDMSGMQIVGWDPLEKSIRSWTFDSDGGFAEATWRRKDGRWIIANRGVLADGRKASMVNVMKPLDDDTFTWQTIERTAGGELLPNVDEVVITRK